MKKIIKKNQVIITSLAILIAVAGYLNFADVDLGFKDQEASTDSSSILEDAGYDLTDETAMLDENNAGDSLGTQDTDTPGEAVLTGSTGFAAQAKVSREQVRSQNKADLQDIINNSEIDDEETADVVVPDAELSDAQRAQIEDIVKRKTGIAAENIVITPLKESQTAEEETQDTAAQTETDGDTADTETAAQPYEDTTVDTTDIYD